VAIAFGILCAVMFGVAIWLRQQNRTLMEQLGQAQARVEELESDLDAALRPRPPTTSTERAVRRVLRTATTLREQGLTGLIQSTIDGVQSWAGDDERADILNMAATDGTVTLFFSDIENSTQLNDKLGDTAWLKVLAAHDKIVRGRVEKYRGQVVKTAGDGFMVAFRDAEAACRAALEIQRDLGRDASMRRHGPIQVRIGIHTGQVVARDGDYFGRNVAMAARVADLATGGEVLASDAVRAALDEDAAVEVAELDPVELKGLPGEHVVWRILPAA
jgi:adenylate cyclase